jgi:hypothetical protein
VVAGKRPKGRPELLSSLLHKSFDGTGLGERLKDLVIWQHWEQVVGAAIARRARPLRLSGGVLTVVVGSAPWMQQLTFMKADLVSRLNSCLGEDGVREIVLKSGRVVEEETVASDPQVAVRQLSDDEQAWIELQISEVADEELQRQLRSLMESHYRHTPAT